MTLTGPPTPHHDPWHIPPPRPKRRRNPHVKALIITVTVLLTGSALALLLTLTIAGPATFTLHGSLLLADSFTRDLDETCRGEGGYSDIAGGTQVTVSDDTGTVIAVGALAPGWGSVHSCILPFTVHDVPAGHEFYQVEVSHRGKIKFREEEAKNGLPTLSLG